MKLLKRKSILWGTAIGVFAIGGYFGLSFISGDTYSAENSVSKIETGKLAEGETLPAKSAFPPVTHIKTPEPLKAIYMTSCVAATPSWREKMTKLVEDTELNAMVIDIKDYSGTISIQTENPIFKENGGKGCRVSDMRQFIAKLHEKEIYTIGRVTVFQDPYYTKAHPEQAVKRLSDGGVWKDHKGLSFVDVGAKPYWDYIVALSKESYGMGFDEINFDYIRFPSDGDMKDIDFTLSRGHTKAEALRKFFVYLRDQLKSTGMIISADLFGMTTTNTDDLNIGQVLENTLPYFD